MSVGIEGAGERTSTTTNVDTINFVEIGANFASTI